MSFHVELNGAEAHVSIGPHDAVVCEDHFRDPADDAGRRRLFAASVQRVVLELTAYCNRRCQFCPNTEGTRLKAQQVLPTSVYERIIRDLASIDYSRTIFFHLYNEPLAAPEVLLPRMRFARECLPRANFALNTNGDYLTPELLRELGDAGCNSIFVSIYGPDHGRWDDLYVEDRVRTMGATLGLKGKLVATPGVEYSLRGTVDMVKVAIGGRNLWKLGYDRGGLVPDLSVPRTSPCLAAITEFLVDHRGYALPCCNVYTDRPEHLRFTTGSLSESGIFTVYAGLAAQRWREGLLKFDPGGPLCSGCSRGEVGDIATAANKAALDGVRKAMKIAPALASVPKTSPEAARPAAIPRSQ